MILPLGRRQRARLAVGLGMLGAYLSAVAALVAATIR